jgi:hypothetical protein
MISFLFVSVAFVGVGVWLQPPSGIVRWLFTGFFTICAAVFGVQLFPDASWLHITAEGFTVCSLFRKSDFVPWRDVSNFRVATVAHHRMVVYDRDTAAKPGLRRLNRSLMGATDGLPDNYGMKQQALADLMNERRALAISG